MFLCERSDVCIKNRNVHAVFLEIPEILKSIKKLVKTLKINKLLNLRGKNNNRRKTRQNADSKQTFDLTRKIEIERKSCQNTENKQTFDSAEKTQN